MIDLEYFPTNETAQRMLSRVSPIYDKSYVGKWIFQVMGLEMEEARAFFEELRLQAYPETCTWGMAYWEQRYGIIPDDSRDLEERRQEVLFKRSFRAPMNPARVEAIIEEQTGRFVEVEENVAPYTFRVTIQDKEDGTVDCTAVTATLRRIKPSHQCFELVVHAPVRSEILYSAGGFISATTMTLPEWEMEYNFSANTKSAVAKILISETKLPPIEP